MLVVFKSARRVQMCGAGQRFTKWTAAVLKKVSAGERHIHALLCGIRFVISLRIPLQILPA